MTARVRSAPNGGERGCSALLRHQTEELWEEELLIHEPLIGPRPRTRPYRTAPALFTSSSPCFTTLLPDGSGPLLQTASRRPALPLASAETSTVGAPPVALKGAALYVLWLPRSPGAQRRGLLLRCGVNWSERAGGFMTGCGLHNGAEGHRAEAGFTVLRRPKGVIYSGIAMAASYTRRLSSTA